MEYKLIRSNRKTLGIQVKDGEVIVRAPMLLSKAKIEGFIALKSEWINKAIKKQQAKPPTYDLSDNDIKLLKEKAKAVLQKKAEYYALLMGVSFGRITIRKQKTRWGSCSSKGNLSFNCMLMRLPEELINYVVVHELAHLKQMNHSSKFWAEVGAVLPNYKALRKELKEKSFLI